MHAIGADGARPNATLDSHHVRHAVGPGRRVNTWILGQKLLYLAQLS